MNETAVREAELTVAQADALLRKGEARAAIDVLTTANRRHRHPELERALVRIRYEGCAAMPAPSPRAGREAIVAEPAEGDLPEVTTADLTVAAIRSGFARAGCLLVRGLVPAERAAVLAAGIDSAYTAFDAAAGGDESYDREWYWPFPMPDLITPENAGSAVTLSPGAPPAGRIRAAKHRKMTRDGAGIWVVDSPRMLFELFELVDDVGIGALMTAFLGERPFLSANKCNVRKVPAEEMTGGWHQDGAFLGQDIGAFNCWIALNRCGRDAPSMDIVARRFDRLVESGNEGAYFKWSLSDQDVLTAADGAPIVRPQFEPGDALLFDHRLVHRTGTSPEMTRERYAIESWWFAPSEFPPSQLPLVY